MKFLLVLILIVLGTFSFSQTSTQSWNSVGIELDVAKKTELKLEFNLRFGSRGLESYFPEADLSYKVTDWYKPSISFRYIQDKDEFTNYLPTNRIQFNNKFSKRVSRFELGARIRYQYEFARWNSNSGFQQKIDQAIRLKPEVAYDIDNSIFSPLVNGEIFYDPTAFNTPFYKYRLGAGVELELDGPHDLSLEYNIDRELNGPKSDVRHIYKLSYTYKF